MPTVNLVPLGLGELLDRTFSIFRKHFWLFAGIMVLPQGLLVGLQILVQILLGFVTFQPHPQTPQAAAQSLRFALSAGVASLGILIPYYIVYATALGATTHALSEVYLGRMATIRDSYRVILRSVWKILHVIFSILIRVFGFFFLVGVLFVVVMGGMTAVPKSMIWMTVIMGLVVFLGFLASIVLAIIFLVRYSVAVPAVVLEKISARQALKRSVALSKGFLWKLLIVGFLMVMIHMVVVSLCQAPFSVAGILIAVKGGRPGLWLTIPSLFVGGLGATATSPLLMISFAIAYYDLRVRKEGFDLQLMMAHLDETANTPLSTPAQPSAEGGDRLEESSISAMVLLTLITGGIYVPIWFLIRRTAINSLRSSDKVQSAWLCFALLGYALTILVGLVKNLNWGSWANVGYLLTIVQPPLLLLSAIIVIVSCFKVRSILLDHLTPREQSMFSAGARLQQGDEISSLATFFLGIFYLQYKINRLIDRLNASEGGQGEIKSPLSPVLPPSPAIS